MENKKYKVKTLIGRSEVYKDILDFTFSFGQVEYNLGDLLDIIVILKTENDSLKRDLEKQKDDEQKVDNLIASSVDMLSKKVATLESELQILKTKTKYM